MDTFMTNVSTLSRRLTPEDIRPGIYIGVLWENHQVFQPPCDAISFEAPKSVMVPCLNCSDGVPRRVLSICLPFVQVEKPDGTLESLDTRRFALVELSEEFGLEAFTRPAKRSRFDEDW